MTTKNKKVIPKISIIITCFNYGKYLDEAIKSVENQSFRDWELIIIDDCSTEQFTKDFIKNLDYYYCNNKYLLNRLTVIQNKVNKKLSASRNIASKKAKGDYILFLDADDKLHQDCLKNMLEAYNRLHTFDIIGSGYQEFGKSNQIKINQFDKLSICIENQLPISFLMKRSFFKKIGGFRENMIHSLEDHDFILKVVENGYKIHIIQKPLLFVRKQESSMLTDFIKSPKMRETQELLVKNNYKLFYWFVKKQETIIRKQRRKIKNLKNYLLGLSIFSIIAIIAGLLI